MRLLHFAVSPETAHIDPDYPYGFRLRCKRRTWIETDPRRGQRIVMQTTNPKIAGREVWNAPKKSTFRPIVVLYLDEVGHVASDGIGVHESAESIDGKIARYGAEAFADPYRSRELATLARVREMMARRRVALEVGPAAGSTGAPQ